MDRLALEKEFERPIWCLLGLSFDALDQAQTILTVTTAINEGRRCMIATPNLNFLITAQDDRAFKESVYNSDLSVADGMPLIWVAKLLQIPLPERVSGSDLMEQLHHKDLSQPIKVFFFGGEPGVGKLASDAVNNNSAGLQAVGHYCPGFGSVEDMSSDEIIASINQKEIDFLIVSLGAKKGQAWIEHNKNNLKATVICHLGAVINFFAGTVKRAPKGFQVSGLEWAWRIFQEPALWKRYFFDGLKFSRLMLFNIIPYAVWMRFHRVELNTTEPVQVDFVVDQGNTVLLQLQGACLNNTTSALRTIFVQVITKQQHVTIDMQQVTIIDTAFIGLCLLLRKHMHDYGGSLNVINISPRNSRIFSWNLCYFLLSPIAN